MMTARRKGSGSIGSEKNDCFPAVKEQLSELRICPDRPLIICDADEVLFAFMNEFEQHLHDNGACFSWASFRLNGNIIDRSTDEPLPVPAVRSLLHSLFEQRARTMETVADAPEMLDRLSRRMQIVVLSNLPHEYRQDRARALRDNGMPFPVVSNEGSKAPAVAALAARTTGTVFFIDDLPHHHAEVAGAASHVVRIHFVSNARLGALLGPAPESHFRANDWPEIRAYIEGHLNDE